MDFPVAILLFLCGPHTVHHLGHLGTIALVVKSCPWTPPLSLIGPCDSRAQYAAPDELAKDAAGVREVC